jgi:hypothetical protein
MIVWMASSFIANCHGYLMGHGYNRKVFHVHTWAILHGAKMVGAGSFWPCCVKREKIIAEFFFCMLFIFNCKTTHDMSEQSQNSIKAK